jgi:hypothetical protein
VDGASLLLSCSFYLLFFSFLEGEESAVHPSTSGPNCLAEWDLVGGRQRRVCRPPEWAGSILGVLCAAFSSRKSGRAVQVTGWQDRRSLARQWWGQRGPPLPPADAHATMALPALGSRHAPPPPRRLGGPRRRPGRLVAGHTGPFTRSRAGPPAGRTAPGPCGCPSRTPEEGKKRREVLDSGLVVRSAVGWR